MWSSKKKKHCALRMCPLPYVDVLWWLLSSNRASFSYWKVWYLVCVLSCFGFKLGNHYQKLLLNIWLARSRDSYFIRCLFHLSEDFWMKHELSKCKLNLPWVQWNYHETNDSTVQTDSSEAASHAGLWFSVMEPEVCKLCGFRSIWNVVSY